VTGIQLDLLAQPLDVGVQGPAVPFGVAPPDAVHALDAGHHVPRLGHQQGQQVELLAGQLDGLAAHLGGAERHVDAHRAERQPAGQLRDGDRDRLVAHPAQDGPDPGRQLPCPQGLGDVVGGAGLEGQHGVELVVPPGDHDHRYRRDGRDVPEHHQGPGIGELHVQQHQGGMGGAHQGDPVVAVRGRDHVEPLHRQGGGQGVTGGLVDVDDQDGRMLTRREQPVLGPAESEGHRRTAIRRKRAQARVRCQRLRVREAVPLLGWRSGGMDRGVDAVSGGRGQASGRSGPCPELPARAGRWQCRLGCPSMAPHPKNAR
jgi:hypothetical protein